jgi:hypothetical protein
MTEGNKNGCITSHPLRIDLRILENFLRHVRQRRDEITLEKACAGIWVRQPSTCVTHQAGKEIIPGNGYALTLRLKRLREAGLAGN